MDVSQLNVALNKIFAEEDARIVFWNDPDQEFTESLVDLELDGVCLLRLEEMGALEVKIRVERDDPDGRYVLYSPTEEPDFDSDWLLDIRLYSRSFRADRASIIMDELGLAHQAVREHITRRRKFFDNKERMQKLKHLVVSTDNELELDRKMLAVVAKAEQPDLFNILRTLYHAMAQMEGMDLDEPPPVWSQIEKFELDETFWSLVRAEFGYAEESPNLRNLLIRLFVADYKKYLNAELPGALLNLQLRGTGTANAVVCLAQWRDSASKGSSYNLLSDEVAARIGFDKYLDGVELEDLLDVVTFSAIEKAIVNGLLERLAATAETVDSDSVRRIANRRQSGHWVASTSVPKEKRKARHAVYEAIAIAAELFALRNQYPSGFEFDSAEGMYQAYEGTLYRFDQLYRLFCENADLAEARSLDVLKSLRDEVERIYANWFLIQLGLTWGKFVDAGLLAEWRLKGVENQYKFFDKFVRPRLEENEKRRVFVVISDAFRYEVAQELCGELNGKYRFEAELSSQLGVLPSYTSLGMASLLPHKELAYKKNCEVMVDGKPTMSLLQRAEILKTVDGMAIKGEDLVALKQAEGRALVADSRVVYVYHNEIDARGDTAATESGTFDAARKAINEISDLVRYIVNTLNSTYVLITADHGFLFTESAPDETDKSRLTVKPSGTVKAKKRYLLGHNLGDHEAALHGRTGNTAKAAGDMEFWVPKSTNRFHFVGGARFVHGGAMLQEVVVPVVQVKLARSGQRLEKTKTRPVTVQVIGVSHKITAQQHRFKLVQMESVSDRLKPSKLKVAVFEGDEPITSIETVTFDSVSGNLDERQKNVILTLQDRPYDKKTQYRLVLRDAETDIEQQDIPVTIDRAIADDFDF